MSDDFPGVRYSTATLDWACEKHDALGEHRRIDAERLRNRLISRLLSRLLKRVFAPLQ
ncbi:hypothetical protein [Haladaptatus sp. DFWS20]|uniref:hypothetical protein n=1 Tax=Haladaptatus sp. DFWS20 TaxID=3403467 RepID=UPI003EC07F60